MSMLFLSGFPRSWSSNGFLRSKHSFRTRANLNSFISRATWSTLVAWAVVLISESIHRATSPESILSRAISGLLPRKRATALSYAFRVLSWISPDFRIVKSRRASLRLYLYWFGISLPLSTMNAAYCSAVSSDSVISTLSRASWISGACSGGLPWLIVSVGCFDSRLDYR